MLAKALIWPMIEHRAESLTLKTKKQEYKQLRYGAVDEYYG